MIDACFERNHLAVKAVYHDRAVSILGCPSAQLTITIGAPTDDRARRRQRASVIAAHRNRVDPAGYQAEIDRHWVILCAAIA